MRVMAPMRVNGRRVAACLLLVLASLGLHHLFTFHSLGDVRNRVMLRDDRDEAKETNKSPLVKVHTKSPQTVRTEKPQPNASTAKKKKQHSKKPKSWRQSDLSLLVQQAVNSKDNAKGSPAHLACQHPYLEVENPEIIHFFHHMDPLTCGEEADWVEVRGSQALITQEARDKHGDIGCSFTELLRDGDNKVQRGLTTTTHDTFTFINTDYYSVSCTAQDGKTWENTVAGIRIDEELRAYTSWDKVPQDSLHLNMLMLGFDSLSHNTFIRTLPKTYAFLTEVLGAHVMEGYNIVGDGTPQQLIPILTGKTELELPEVRRRMGKQAQFVNTYPFIWNDYKKNGYVTLYAEDGPHIGTFQYRLRGFDTPPTDHYTRPFYLQADSESKKHPRLCLRNTPRHKVLFNYLHNFMTEYRNQPKFAFAFHSELSHDYINMVSVADQDLLNFLTTLRDEGHLNNTLLILMSDHGHRFTSIRSTQQGKQEERLPFMSLVLPPSFQAAHPSAADNVRMNIHRLTTPFDLFPTMEDLLHFQGARLGQVTDRGISLFSQVPAARTCADAFIEPHWCACLTWEAMNVADNMVQRAAQALVHYINTHTAPHRSICHELTLSQTVWAGKLLPTKGLLNFKKNADLDGFVPDMTDETKVSDVGYQVTVITEPSQARYEATLTYSLKLDTFSVKIDDVSRANKYGDQAHCVEKTLFHLRKFCYCKEPPPAPPQDNT